LFQFARLKRGKSTSNANLLSRAHGCLIGQVAGDALGQLVEFSDPQSIQKKYPKGLREMHDGGTWRTIAGQPTDDSELALMLARCIAADGKYVHENAAEAYYYWLETRPFDVGNTISKALRSVSEKEVKVHRAAAVMMKNASRESQANGSLMRISPLSIHAYRKSIAEIWHLACEDSALTHPNPICQQSCAIYVCTIADAIESGRSPQELYERALKLAYQMKVESSVQDALENAKHDPPQYEHSPGWVLVALQNAFYQLIRANTFEEGVIDTAMRGFDSDTNGAIAGALLGAVHGRESIPFAWRQMVLSCRAHPAPGIQHPRPYCFWPVDLLNLAEVLLATG
jgi:ADP-ribosylglycohydrolase